MTVDEFKSENPRDSVFIQIDDVVRIMTPDEYEAWCIDSVNNINDNWPPIPQ